MQHSQDEETIDKRNCVREKITERLIYIYMILYYKILHTRMTFIRSIDCMHVHIAPASHFDFFIVLRSKIWPKLNLTTVWWTDRQFVDVLKHAEYILKIATSKTIQTHDMSFIIHVNFITCITIVVSVTFLNRMVNIYWAICFFYFKQDLPGHPSGNRALNLLPVSFLMNLG